MEQPGKPIAKGYTPLQTGPGEWEMPPMRQEAKESDANAAMKDTTGSVSESLDDAKETGSVQPAKDLTRINNAQADLNDLKADKEKLDAEQKELETGHDSSSGEAGDYDKLRAPDDKVAEDHAKPKADHERIVSPEDQGPSGPRFERPDWSPDDESAMHARRPEPPPRYERIEPPPPPPRQAAPPPPAPVSRSVTELDELMSRLKNLSRK
jgi:hypothetical protein